MAYLEIVEGDNRGKTVRLTSEIVIGRNADNALYLPDSSVSRQHAVVRQRTISLPLSTADLRMELLSINGITPPCSAAVI